MDKTVICGIYKITNVVNNKCYVGLSIDIKRRWRNHLNELNKNKHYNKYFQRSWNKYGGDNFKFEILERCESNKLSDKEQYWISYYDSYKNGYNASLGGEQNITNITKYTFYNPDGRIEKDIMLSEMIIKYNLDNSKIYAVAKGNRRQTHNWYLNKELLPILYTFYHKDGNIEKNITSNEMIKRYNIKNGHLSSVISGTEVSANGWYFNKELLPKRNSFKHKDGTICNNVTNSFMINTYGVVSVSMLLNGKLKTSKGWSLVKQ